jgi:anti-sigma factor RsiW
MSTDPRTREQLSALADGELGPDETRFLLRRLEAEPALAAQWQRLHLVRASLRGELGPLADAGFAAAVAARLPSAAAPAAVRGWRRTALGGAIAAGVAALALFAIAPQQPAAPGGVPVLADVAPVRTGDLARQLPAQRVSDRAWTPLPVAAPIDPRLESYYLRHGGAAAASPRGGFIPYVYVVATPSAAAPIPLREPEASAEPR